jgi:hypothetical protein
VLIDRRVLRRSLSAVLVCLVAAAYAKAGAAGVIAGYARFAPAIGQDPPALCPTGRTGTQIGRQTDGRAGMPLAPPAALLAASLTLAGPALQGICFPGVDRAHPLACVASDRLIRGPPDVA